MVESEQQNKKFNKVGNQGIICSTGNSNRLYVVIVGRLHVFCVWKAMNSKVVKLFHSFNIFHFF